MGGEDKKKSAKAAKEAKELAERQAAAENAFATADADGSGSVDAKELQGLLITMLQQQRIEFDRQVVAEFVNAEFSKADTDGSGDVDFDEFIAYYNGLLDRITGGAMNDALEEAKKATAKKLEEEAIAQDGDVFTALHGVLTMLSSPSVKAYTGLVVPFQVKDLRGSNPESTPNPEHGSSSHGIILDLSRRAQRLLTPWGSLPIGYRLAFPGYQEKAPPAEDEADKEKGGGRGAGGRPKKGPVPWQLVPANPAEDETYPLFFALCKPPRKALPDEATPPKPPLMRLRKLPMKCHFQVVELFGRPVPAGEALLLHDAAQLKKLQERWQACLKKSPKDPKFDQLIPPDESDGGPLVNHLAGACVAVRADRLDALKKRKEVTSRAANKRFAEADMHIALKMCNNNDQEAARLLVRMFSAVNTVLDRRQGHSTRAQVTYALQTVEYDADAAEYMLKNQDKVLKQKVDFISEKLGLESGLGYPTRQTLERMLVAAQLNEGAVMAELKKRARPDIEAMAEVVAAAEVEEMLTPERCDAFAFARPACTPEEASHAEALYLSDEFKKDQERVVHFLTQAGTVLKRSLGAATRDEVEQFLRDMGNEAERVLTFLSALSNMCDLAPKQGQATREDCIRYLVQCDREEGQATEFMRTVWKLSNPKAPKPPAKGSKKPPQPHYAEICGFPTRAEAEWALLSTRAQGKEGQPLDIGKAVELLTKLDTISNEIKAGEKHSGCKREDVVWALDPTRCSLRNPAASMLDAISHILKRGAETGLKTSRQEILTSLEKLGYDQTATEKYLNGVGTLMSRQGELGIVSREEVEEAMEANEMDDGKVIELFTEAATLQSRKLEIGNPSREEIKAMLSLAWGTDPSERVEVTSKCLSIYRQLMADDTTLLSLFGKSPEEEERLYLRSSALRFKGDHEQTMNYLKKVSDIVSKGEALGSPTRELVVQTLEDFGLDARKATQRIREDYHTRRDLQLKEEYKRNKEAAEAKSREEAAAA